MVTMKFERPIDNVKLLIQLVESKPELYDPKHKLYTHRYAHANAWREIAAKLKVPVHEFRLKWNCVRNSYVRMLRKRVSNPYSSKWYLEENLAFLKKILDEKKKKNSLDGNRQSTASFSKSLNANQHSNDIQFSNIDKTDSNENIELNELMNIESRSLNESDDSEIDKIKMNKLNKKYKKTKNDLKEFEKIFDLLTNYFSNNIEPKNNVNNNENCSDLFFQSIKKDCEKLPEQKKRKFKLIALSAINELLDEQD